MSGEQIHMPQDRWTDALLEFITESPLWACVTVGYDGGVQVVRADRAFYDLSSGEQQLWLLLKSLASGASVDMRAVLNHADEATLRALSRMFRLLGQEEAA